MEIKNKNPKIYLLSAKARHGKDTAAGFLKKFYEADGKKVIFEIKVCISFTAEIILLYLFKIKKNSG